jgi:alpha-1,3-glucosyltransferase
VNFFAKGQDVLGAIFFVLSLGFKQMALYYAPAIGSYLVGKCIYLGFVSGCVLVTYPTKNVDSQPFRGRLFIRLGLVASLTFILLFLPFLPPFAPLLAIFDPITRIFPFNRGLFEDKVANFWCASNVVFKWKYWASPDVLVKLSAGLTAIGFLPSVVGVIQGSWKSQLAATDKDAAPPVTPTVPLLPFALLTSSMSFFLFSFQVHEKTILVPLLPITLILSGSSPESSAFDWCVLANNVGVFRCVFNFYMIWLVYVSYLQHVAVAQTRWVGRAVYRNVGIME